MSLVMRKPVFGDFQPGPTMKKRDCTVYVAKTKALISCAVTAQLICAFVFTYEKINFSHDEAHI